MARRSGAHHRGGAAARRNINEWGGVRSSKLANQSRARRGKVATLSKAEGRARQGATAMERRGEKGRRRALAAFYSWRACEWGAVGAKAGAGDADLLARAPQ
jgi:hypothetical protein